MGIEEACRCIEKRFPDLRPKERKNYKEGVAYFKDKERIVRISQNSVTSDLRLLLAVTKRCKKRNGLHTVVIYRESQLYTNIEQELSLCLGS